MDDLYKKKIKKIYKKLESLSSKGKDNILEYHKYITEIVDKGDYSVFEEVINLYYGIDMTRYNTVESSKKVVWEKICFQSKLPLLTKLTNLYKNKGVYQQSFNIYKEDTGEIIGQIKEDIRTTNDINYLIKNRMYARLVGERIPFLEVIDSDGVSTIIDDYDYNLTPEQNQLNYYIMAIDMLLI